MDDFDLLCQGILDEFHDNGIDTTVETWGAPYMRGKTHCISCKYPLCMYVYSDLIKIRWKYCNNWRNQDWDLVNPNSIEFAIFWFIRRYQCIEILDKRGYQI